MQSTEPVGSGTPNRGSSSATLQAANEAFGLSFDSLLRIILTQLSYQDPLKPMENFEFVSQLAQFSQIQQGQAMNERLEALVNAQATIQATSLLGRAVDISLNGSALTGVVKAIAFENSAPTLTIETADNRTLSGLSVSSVSQLREGE